MIVSRNVSYHSIDSILIFILFWFSFLLHRETWRATIFCIALSTLIIQRPVFGQNCQIGDLNHFIDSLKNCERLTEVKFITLNVTTFQSIPKDLINRTQSVQSIDVSNTSLQFINETSNFCQWPNLTFINAVNNNITELPAHMLRDCHLLGFLSLANNKIVQIYEEAFQGLALLTELDLSNNQITSLSAGTFHPLSQLKILRLNNNQIGAIDKDHFSHNFNLQMLDLSYNSVGVIEEGSFSRLRELTTLNLAVNPNLNALDLDKMDHLRDVTVNNASLLQLHIPKSVTNIEANDNKIAHVTIEPNSSLQRLSLQNNVLRNISDLSAAQKLSYLDITNNNITNIDFIYLMQTNIGQLIILENPIHRLNVTTLTSLPKISIIEISTSFLDKQILTELLTQTQQKKIRLIDPNRESERHNSTVTLPPVTPMADNSKIPGSTAASTNRVTSTTASPGPATSKNKDLSSNSASGSITPSDAKGISDDLNQINETLHRIQNLELTVRMNEQSAQDNATHFHNHIAQKVASLRIMVICTMMAIAILVVAQILVFAAKHWPMPIANVFSRRGNGRLNNSHRNPFNDSMDPIIEEVL